MSDLVVAVILLGATVTILYPRRTRRERGDGPLSHRAVRHLLDDDTDSMGNRKGGST